MRYLFTVGPVLAAVFTSFALHAHSLTLLDLELGPAEQQDLLRLASADTPSEMVRLLVERHRDLDLRTLDEDDPRRGHYDPRFEVGPRGVLWLAADADRAEIFHEYLHYLIDRVRLRKHPAQTIAVGKSFAAWKAELGARFEQDAPVNGGARVRLSRLALEGRMIHHGEEADIVLLLLQKAHRLGLGSLKRQERYAKEHLGLLLDEWHRMVVSNRRYVDRSVSPEDLAFFSEVGLRIGRADEILRDCGDHL